MCIVSQTSLIKAKSLWNIFYKAKNFQYLLLKNGKLLGSTVHVAGVSA